MEDKLWNRNFIILFLGSAITILGHSISSFAISLMVLDYTGSILAYSLFIIAYYIPKTIILAIAGTLLDRISRIKMIWILDYVSSLVYIVAFVLIKADWFSFFPMLVWRFFCWLH